MTFFSSAPGVHVAVLDSVYRSHFPTSRSEASLRLAFCVSSAVSFSGCQLNIPCLPAAETLEENQTVTALMKRLSLSAEDKERSAAVSEIVDLVKKGGVGALKVLQPLLFNILLSLGSVTPACAILLVVQLACQHGDTQLSGCCADDMSSFVFTLACEYELSDLAASELCSLLSLSACTVV